MAFGDGCGELWECESSHSGGLLNFTCVGTNKDGGSGWVDVGAQVTFSQVDTTGSTINDVSFNKRKWGRYGRLWVEVRHTGRGTSFGR